VKKRKEKETNDGKSVASVGNKQRERDTKSLISSLEDPMTYPLQFLLLLFLLLFLLSQLQICSNKKNKRKKNTKEEEKE